jgi:hypothetical protein
MLKLGSLNNEQQKEIVKITWREFVKLNGFKVPNGRYPIKFIFLPSKYDGAIVFAVETSDKIFNVKKTLKKEELKELLEFIGLNKKTNYDSKKAVFVVEDGVFGIDIDNEKVFYKFSSWGGWTVKGYKEVVSSFEDDDDAIDF